jgi:Mor family transcriptional regulator
MATLYEIRLKLGDDLADKLIATCPGLRLYIPSKRSICAKQRNLEIFDAYSKGMKKSEIAIQYGLSARQIHKILTEKLEGRKYEGFMQQLIDTLGTDAMKLISNFGGDTVYVPKAIDKYGEIEWRNQAIRAEFNGKNSKALARKYGMSERYLINIAKGDS